MAVRLDPATGRRPRSADAETAQARTDPRSRRAFRRQCAARTRGPIAETDGCPPVAVSGRACLKRLRRNGRFSAGSFSAPSDARRGSRLGSHCPVHAGRRTGPGPAAQASPGPPRAAGNESTRALRLNFGLRQPGPTAPTGATTSVLCATAVAVRAATAASFRRSSALCPKLPLHASNGGEVAVAARLGKPAPVGEISRDLTGTPDGWLPCRQPAERWRMRRSCGRGVGRPCSERTFRLSRKAFCTEKKEICEAVCGARPGAFERLPGCRGRAGASFRGTGKALRN